jgi:SAM-dependent methyltransferase
VNPPEYARMFETEGRYWWFVSRRRLARRLLAESGPAGTVLDLGCGTGALLDEMSGQAIGLDFSPLALQFCRERGLAGLVQGDAQKLPFRDASLAAVVSLDTLEHVPDDRAALAEIARCLAPGGALVLNVPAYRWLWGPHDVALMHCRRYTKGEIVGRVREAGLDVEQASYSVFLLFPVVVALRGIDKLRQGEAEVRLPRVPTWLNSLLVALMDAEAAVLRAIGLPWGSSVVLVARKPRSRSA